jgi:riboflavin synthase
VSKKKKSPSRPVRIGIVDTMFARYNMGAAALAELQECPGYGTTFTTLSRTVPGFKDLAVAAKNLIERDGCSIVVALGMPGSAPIDKQCAHEAAQGIMLAQLLTSTPILEVFVHEDEADDPAVLASVFENRSRKHARNAYWMLFDPEQLRRRAGQGVRQGFDDAGPLPDVSANSADDLLGQPEDALGNDVALHDRRAAADT